MSNGPDFSALGQVFPEAKSIICFIHPQATYDAVAAATSLCLAAKAAGKSCEVMCEEPMRVEYNYLVGIEKITQSVGNRDLVISFDYDEEQVDKVSYNIDEQSQRFELIIAPKSGAQPLDPSTINFSRAGLSADVMFLFGFHSLNELGEIYQKEQYVFDQAYTVALTQSKIQPFAKLHLTLRPDNFSYSEMVYFMIRQLQMTEVKEDLATNLLSGLEYATERLMQPNLSARVFETVATLLRQGARRQPDNPAFEHLNTPIREVEAAASTPASMGQSGFSRPMSGQIDPAFPSGSVTPVQGQPESVPGQTGPRTQNVSASEFAQAMQSGSSQQS